MNVIAPGKVFLFGEYAVLEGAPALVMGVTRYARARRAAPVDSTRLMELVHEAVAPELGEGPEAVPFDVDSSELRSGERKLGLGSSAASCVAGAALLFHAAGQSLASETVRRRIFRAARAAHDRLQGEPGSGADVAASVSGGLLRYEPVREGGWERVHLPPPLHLLWVETGQEASTAELVGRVRALRSAQPSVYNRRVQVLCDLAELIGPRPSDRQATELCLLVHSYAAHLEALGADAGAPIVSEVHHRIAEIARACGCAAKPSGAGEGDLAVVFCPDSASSREARAALAAQGFSLLRLDPDPAGVRLEPDADGA